MRLIDAAEVIKAVDKHTFETKDGLCLDDDISIILEDVPTIEERKMGEWINITNYESLDEEYKCSVCGYELYYSYPTKFCPNCGADMRGEE